MEDRQPLFTDAELRELAAFQLFACEGMSYTVDPLPMNNYCTCGRVISANRTICRACSDRKSEPAQRPVLATVAPAAESEQADA